MKRILVTDQKIPKEIQENNAKLAWYIFVNKVKAKLYTINGFEEAFNYDELDGDFILFIFEEYGDEFKFINPYKIKWSDYGILCINRNMIVVETTQTDLIKSTENAELSNHFLYLKGECIGSFEL